MGAIVLMTVGLAAEAAWLAWTGKPVAGVPLAAAALYLGHIVGLSTRVWWRPWPSRQPATLTTTPDGTTGVRFRYSSWSYYWLTAILVMNELVLLVVALGAALSATLVGVVAAVVLGLLVVWMGWMLVTMLRLAPGSLIVSPTGWSTAAWPPAASSPGMPWSRSPPTGSARRSSRSKRTCHQTPGSAATWADSARGS